jgi:hypothetical protein
VAAARPVGRGGPAGRLPFHPDGSGAGSDDATILGDRAALADAPQWRSQAANRAAGRTNPAGPVGIAQPTRAPPKAMSGSTGTSARSITRCR